MKKLLSLGLILLLCAASPLQAMAASEAMPEPAPSSPAETVQPDPAAPPQENTAPETLPELPVPDSPAVPVPSVSPSPEPEPEAPRPSVVPESPVAPSIFDFLEGSNATMEVDMIAYYLTEMSAAAVKGDTKAGHEAEKNRNSIIDLQGSTETKIAFDDLYLLAKLICAEAGSSWLSNDFRLCVGEVVLNRVASPEFPDTIHDVIYQKNQYSSVSSPGFCSLIPSQDCVDVALRLLQGERQMVPSVVFQSNYAQGEIFSIHTDRQLGDTFFCVSPNLDLYP